MEDFLIISGYLFLAINLFLFSISFRKQNSKAYRVIVYYLLLTLIIQLLSAMIAYSNKTINNGDNLFLSHFYFIGQFILLSLFYFHLLKMKILKKTLLFITLGVTFLLCYIFIDNPNIFFQFSLTEIVACSLPIVLYSLFYFFESFGVENKKYLILNSGIFIYLLCSTLIFSSGNLINGISNLLTAKMVWTINVSLYLVYQTLIFIEWYKNFRK